LVQISHGMCEYFLRYKGFAEYLSSNGFLVFGHDHLGHGRSVSAPEELGFTVSGGGADALVEDLSRLALKFKEDYPGLPIILLGHSMGSFLARDALARYSDVWQAAIVMGTAGPDMPTSAGKLLASCLIALRGERYRAPLLRKISFAGYNKRYEKGCDENAWLSRDGEVVRRYHEDPLCGFLFTVRAYHDLFTVLGRVSRKDWATKLQKELPLLLVSGENDPVGGWGKGVEKLSRRLFEAGLSKMTFKLYPDMRHEILNELSYQTVWEDLLLWMQKSVLSPN